MGADSWKIRDAGSYDAQAALYGRYIARLAPPLARRTCELAGLREGARVLDVGCGTGLATREAAQRVGAAGGVVGVDLSHGMVDAARSLTGTTPGAPPEFRVMDAEALEFPDATFDAVTSLCAVPHFPDISAAVGEMHRVLKPGGRVVMSFGSVRPVSAAGAVRHVVRRVTRELQRPLRPQLRAPVSLVRHVAAELPEPAEAMLTDWGAAQMTATLLRETAAAGFVQLRKEALSYDVQFDSATEFWEAQMAIATPARKRLELAPDAHRDALRQTYIARAQRVLDRGGELVYPYGAVFVSGVRA